MRVDIFTNRNQQWTPITPHDMNKWLGVFLRWEGPYRHFKFRRVGNAWVEQATGVSVRCRIVDADFETTCLILQQNRRLGEG